MWPTTSIPAERQKKMIGIGRDVRGQHRDGPDFPIQNLGGRGLRDPRGRQFFGVLRDLRRASSGGIAGFNQLQADLVHLARCLGRRRNGRGARPRAQPAADRGDALSAGRSSGRTRRTRTAGGLVGQPPSAIFWTRRCAKLSGPEEGHPAHASFSSRSASPGAAAWILNHALSTMRWSSRLFGQLARHAHRGNRTSSRQTCRKSPSIQCRSNRSSSTCCATRSMRCTDSEKPKVAYRQRGVPATWWRVHGRGQRTGHNPADTLPNLFRAFSSSKGDGLRPGLGDFPYHRPDPRRRPDGRCRRRATVAPASRFTCRGVLPGSQD